MDKYGCGNCGHTWYDNEEPTKCPKCKDWDIYPVLVCDDCGLEDAKEDFPYNRLFDGMCAECFVKSVSDDKVSDYISWCPEYYGKDVSDRNSYMCDVINYSYGLELDYITDIVAIEALFYNLEKLLKSTVESRNEKEKIIIENAREWVFDDLEAFYDDWYDEYGR